jgi:hypothetical protein
VNRAAASSRCGPRLRSAEFLVSAGANEFAGRYTAGHFDLAVMRTTISVDDIEVVPEGCCWTASGSFVTDRHADPSRRQRCRLF